MDFTSSSVNPKHSSNGPPNTSSVLRLFRPENRLSLAILMTPVMIPNLSDSLDFRADERNLLMNDAILSCAGFRYDLFMGASYSSISTIVFTP
jgi:hypothetical protein